jgi:hypothetical protein
MDATKWVKKGQYIIKDAQPSHYNEPGCANVHGGQDCESFHAVTLPKGMFDPVITWPRRHSMVHWRVE